jgi:EmrB/QacA subfamily drug resistance transporter
MTIEPARPRAVAERPGAYWLVLAAVCIGAFMGQLDASIVTVAFPTLARSFHSSLISVQWVGLSYTIVLVATVAAVGRLADVVGRKLLYVYGFVVFIVGSALCGIAPSLAALVGFRLLQAVGAAMLQANSVAIVATALPARRLSQGIGIQGAAQALGLALGPALGGLLIAAGGWRLVFFVNVPVGVVGCVLGWLLIPRSRDLKRDGAFDWLGFATFLPAMSALLLAVSYGNERGWLSPAIIGAASLGVALGAVFISRERRARAPLIDLGLFRNPDFSISVLGGMLSYVALFGTLFVVPFYLENARHLSPAQAGAALTAMPVAFGLTAPIAGRLADRHGARALTSIGMLIAGAALVALALRHAETPTLVAELALLGAGLGAFTPANNALIMSSAPVHQAGQAGGILNMTRGVGTALGLSVTGLILGLAAGAQPGLTMLNAGFRDACLVLAATTLLAAAAAWARPTSLSPV